jgi:hypothetical protein
MLCEGGEPNDWSIDQLLILMIGYFQNQPWLKGDGWEAAMDYMQLKGAKRKRAMRKLLRSACERWQNELSNRSLCNPMAA